MNKYYVYQHVDNDDTIVYIGMGSGCRVWNSFSRDKEHRKWMEERMPSNFKWIILASNLSQKEACALEYNLIATIKTRFNKGYASGANNGRTGKPSARQRKVLNKDTGEIFESIKAASLWASRDENSIGNCCKGRTPRSAGYKWEYYNEPT